MNENKKGKIEIIVGVILFFALLGIGFWIRSTLGAKYAPEFGYLYIVAPLLMSLIIGLLGGILLLSGYYRISGKRETNFTPFPSEQKRRSLLGLLQRFCSSSITFSVIEYRRIIK